MSSHVSHQAAYGFFHTIVFSAPPCLAMGSAAADA